MLRCRPEPRELGLHCLCPDSADSCHMAVDTGDAAAHCSGCGLHQGGCMYGLMWSLMSQNTTAPQTSMRQLRTALLTEGINAPRRLQPVRWLSHAAVMWACNHSTTLPAQQYEPSNRTVLPHALSSCSTVMTWPAIKHTARSGFK